MSLNIVDISLASSISNHLHSSCTAPATKGDRMTDDSSSSLSLLTFESVSLLSTQTIGRMLVNKLRTRVAKND